MPRHIGHTPLLQHYLRLLPDELELRNEPELPELERDDEDDEPEERKLPLCEELDERNVLLEELRDEFDEPTLELLDKLLLLRVPELCDVL